MNNRPQPVLLDMASVGAILNIPEAEAAALVEARRLRGFQVGDQWQTRPCDVGAYLAEQRIRAAPSAPTLARTVKS